MNQTPMTQNEKKALLAKLNSVKKQLKRGNVSVFKSLSKQIKTELL